MTAGYRAGARQRHLQLRDARGAWSRSIPGTGLIEILDYVVVEDGGVLVNPMIVDGQVCGGTAQGIGTCLYEAMPFDAQGQPLASTLLDYLLPGATDVPDIRVLHMETPSPYTEFGMKGIGEGGAVGPAGGDRLGRQRRAAAAGRRGARPAADAGAHPGRDRCRCGARDAVAPARDVVAP